MATTELKDVSETLLIPLAARAGAERFCPELGFVDPAAARMRERLGMDLSRFHGDLASMRGCCARAQWLDRQTLSFAGGCPAALVISLGAGLDTVRERLQNAMPEDTHWVDVDLPAVVALKRKLGPGAANESWIAADVTTETWLRQLPDAAGRRVVVRAEGLLMYLDEASVQQLLRRLAEHFSGRAAGALLAFDWVSPFGARISARHPSLRQTSMSESGKPPFQWAYTGPAPMAAMTPRWQARAELDLMALCGAKARWIGRFHRALTGRSFVGCSSFELQP